MAERRLRSRSRTREKDSSESISNMNLATRRGNIIVESEANSTVKVNPVVEVNMQDSELTNFNNDNATILVLRHSYRICLPL
jgi:adenylate kinase